MCFATSRIWLTNYNNMYFWLCTPTSWDAPNHAEEAADAVLAWSGVWNEEHIGPIKCKVSCFCFVVHRVSICTDLIGPLRCLNPQDALTPITNLYSSYLITMDCNIDTHPHALLIDDRQQYHTKKHAPGISPKGERPKQLLPTGLIGVFPWGLTLSFEPNLAIHDTAHILVCPNKLPCVPTLI